jgi:hypothetical protein
VNLQLIKKVICGEYFGTAFVVDPIHVATAQHVVQNSSECSINGEQVNILYSDEKLDFSIGEMTIPFEETLPINCNGFVEGEEYFAIGYTGNDRFVIEKLLALGTDVKISTNTKDKKMLYSSSLLIGRVHHGMSGGPIVNRSGEVVGTTLAILVGTTIPLAASRPLKDTKLCPSGNRE